MHVTRVCLPTASCCTSYISTHACTCHKYPGHAVVVPPIWPSPRLLHFPTVMTAQINFTPTLATRVLCRQIDRPKTQSAHCKGRLGNLRLFPDVRIEALDVAPRARLNAEQRRFATSARDFPRPEMSTSWSFLLFMHRLCFSVSQPSRCQGPDVGPLRLGYGIGPRGPPPPGGG